MRLITPKRLKENEDAMWALADQALDDFLPPGRGEWIKGFASPFTLLVIADLLACPWRIATSSSRASPSTQVAASGHRQGVAVAQSVGVPLRSFLRLCLRPPREPRDDVLTGLATATYPDGSIPEVEDVARVASNVFSAGQETTVRLLGAALQTLGERPDIQAQLRKDRSLLPNFIEESLRHESPVKGDFRLNRVPSTSAGSTCRRHHGDDCAGGGHRDPRRFEDPLRSIRPARTRVSTSRSAAASTAAPVHRWRGPKPASRSSGYWIAPPTSGSTRTFMARPMTAATNTFRRTFCVA